MFAFFPEIEAYVYMLKKALPGLLLRSALGPLPTQRLGERSDASHIIKRGLSWHGLLFIFVA